jgi:hypothetical protein
MSIRIVEGFAYLLPDLNNLNEKFMNIPKPCYLPYIHNQEHYHWYEILIKHVCEPCSAQDQFKACKFYEATHLDIFQDEYKRIMNDQKIPKPPGQTFRHPAMNRLCLNKINLQDLLEYYWKIEKGKIESPFCENLCPYIPDRCEFYNRNLMVNLVYYDIESWNLENQDGFFEIKYIKEPKEYSKDGYIKGSYLYKTFHQVDKSLQKIIGGK